MPRADVDLPQWTTGHKVKTSGETQQDSRPASDVDLPDWAPGHKVPSRYSGSHPGQAEREESYHWAQDASRAQDAETPPDARHDTSARWVGCLAFLPLHQVSAPMPALNGQCQLSSY